MKKGRIRLAGKMESTGGAKIVDTVVEQAMELPIESQEIILTVAKAMQYTRYCMKKEEGSHLSQEEKGKA